mgnify:CR=1 FL=1
MITTAPKLSVKISAITIGIAINVLLIIILSIPALWRSDLTSTWIRKIPNVQLPRKQILFSSFSFYLIFET